MHMNTKKLTGIAACVALMAVCSWISIPFAIPFTCLLYTSRCV